MVIIEGMSPRAAVKAAEARLCAANCPDADFDARELFRLAAGRDSRLSDKPLSAAEAAKLEEYCARREKREPLQYICGHWPFLDFELAVGEGVLCPRADTETVVERAAELLAASGSEKPRVLDLCAGSGCIGIGVKRLCPAAEVVCLEKSEAAFKYLEKNARCALASAPCGSAEDTLEETALDFDFDIPAALAAVKPVRGDIFDYWRALSAESLDMITANPPYLTAAEMAVLQPEVAREPAEALAAGEDGLEFYRAIARDYLPALKHGGALVLEIGCAQREAVSAILAASGWVNIACRKDLGGLDRCVSASRP